ncbi:MAG: anaerobic ribonucleoside-triphosphate reductase activating protein [Caldicoprobacterales bacterium]
MNHDPENKIRIAGVVEESIVDGPGIRYVVFAQGCPHRCPGCHNPKTHSFDGGILIDIGDILKAIKNNPLLDGITLSGGEPFEQAAAFARLAEKVRELELDVIVYTGYTYEELIKHAPNRPSWESLLNAADILIDGPFIMEQKSYMLKFRGSANQRIIDLKKTRKTGEIVFY